MENVKEGDSWGILVVDGRIILNKVLITCCGKRSGRMILKWVLFTWDGKRRIGFEKLPSSPHPPLPTSCIPLEWQSFMYD